MNMSELKEDVVIPWVGPLSCKNTLTVMVLSQNNKIIERISEALTEVHNKGIYRWKLKVLRAFFLEDIYKQSNIRGRIALDFIILAIDTSRLFCMDWVKTQLSQIDPDMKTRRVVLVNAGGLPINAMAVSSFELITFQADHELDLLTANVINDNVSLLARRLLKYIEVSFGVKTGIPNLNI